MRYTIFFLAALLLGCTSKPSKTSQADVPDSNTPKGTLFIVGGGERSEELMRRYLHLAGGEKSRVLVVPFASGYVEETAEEQCNEFMQIGCDTAYSIICAKEEVDSPENLAKLDGVTAVFFSGGDQNNLTAYLAGTKFLEKVRDIYQTGGVIGGTSAGAAIMSKVMITGKESFNSDEERSFEVIKKGNVLTAEGFGFVTSAVIDQHFIIRKRQNRLISVVLEHPNLKGIGIDESTAIIVKADGTFEVVGESGVMIFENMAPNAPLRADRNGYLSAAAIKLTLLTAGDTCRL